MGEFSLSIVLYGQSRRELDALVGEFASVFTNADGNLFVESYNQLNAYFATVPGTTHKVFASCTFSIPTMPTCPSCLRSCRARGTPMYSL